MEEIERPRWAAPAHEKARRRHVITFTRVLCVVQLVDQLVAVFWLKNIHYASCFFARVVSWFDWYVSRSNSIICDAARRYSEANSRTSYRTQVLLRVSVHYISDSWGHGEFMRFHLCFHRKLGSRALTDDTAGKFFIPHLSELNLDCVWISSRLL